MNKETKENLSLVLFILLIIFGCIIFHIILNKAGERCTAEGGKAVYTNYGSFEKCIK